MRVPDKAIDSAYATAIHNGFSLSREGLKRDLRAWFTAAMPFIERAVVLRERRATVRLLKRRVRFYRREDFEAVAAELEQLIATIEHGEHV